MKPSDHDLLLQLAKHGEAIPLLADQLKNVIRQTEQAALEINERFMSIAGRTRKLMAADESSTLSRDIQDIIVSLQFQDITRQHIERVIERLLHMQREIETMRSQLGHRDPAEKHTACR